jgi:hypothetical protein
MSYNFVIIDRIFCECYIKWTYEENENTDGREGIYKLHEKSAIKKSNDEPCLLWLTSVTREELEKQYMCSERDMCHVSSIIEASGEFVVSSVGIEEIDAILKGASYLKWKGFNFCILTGNSLLYDTAKKQGFDVYYLNDADIVLRSSI